MDDLTRQGLAALAEADTVGRLWRRDRTLWPGPGDLDALGWLEYPAAGLGRLDGLLNLHDSARRRGMSHAALLGMGGSSLAAAVFASLYEPATGIRFRVLDSTVPGQVAAVEAELNPQRTLFLTASKSGTTTEVWALLDHFRTWLERAGIESPLSRFAAISDPGSPLLEFAAARGMATYIPGDPRVGGRYSAFTPFGLIAPAMLGQDLRSLSAAGEVGRRACGPGVEPAANPGARLAALLAGQARGGRDKLTLLLSPRLARLGLWIEQLVAESLGKDGRGIVPVCGEPPLAEQHYGPDRFFCYLRLAGDQNQATDLLAERLEGSGFALQRRRVPGVGAVPGEMFIWMFAVALAGALLEMNPFDQPDVQAAKDKTASLLAGLAEGRELAALPAGDFGQWANRLPKGGYAALLSYYPETAEYDQAVAGLAGEIGRLGIAVTSAYGPRYLHSTGQLHKGGPRNGSFLFLAPTRPPREAPLAGSQFGLGTLAHAQAGGDLARLAELDLNVAGVDLGGDPVAGINGLASQLAGSDHPPGN